jgi:anti-sigma factor RsiW
MMEPVVGMQCEEVEERLVALQDDELSPSEREQVVEHLDHCHACRGLERRLRLATPFPGLVVPPHIQARLDDRLDTSVLLELADRPSQPAPRGAVARARRWLDAETEVSRVVVLAAAAMLVTTLGWGVTNWWSLAHLQAEMAQRAEVVIPPARTASGAEIPAEQFRPAAYTPEEEEVFH